jgi:putative heme-binding domain-containing protein
MRWPSSFAGTARQTVLILLITAPMVQPAEDGPSRFPRTPPTEPGSAAATFRTLHGFRMELIAAEPLVFDPYPEVAPDYLEYTVSLDDGRILTGLVVAESCGRRTLRRPGGAEDTVLRTNIDASAGTGKSLMPEGLEARVSPQAMIDLIAFLKGVQP